MRWRMCADPARAASRERDGPDLSGIGNWESGIGRSFPPGRFPFPISHFPLLTSRFPIPDSPFPQLPRPSVPAMFQDVPTPGWRNR